MIIEKYPKAEHFKWSVLKKYAPGIDCQFTDFPNSYFKRSILSIWIYRPAKYIFIQMQVFKNV